MPDAAADDTPPGFRFDAAVSTLRHYAIFIFATIYSPYASAQRSSARRQAQRVYGRCQSTAA